MEKVRVQVAKTPEGYCATVDILPGFIVAVTGDFSELKKSYLKVLIFTWNVPKLMEMYIRKS